MKDIVCLVTFVSKLLGLVAFVLILRPHGISPIQATSKPQVCEMARVHPLRQNQSC